MFATKYIHWHCVGRKFDADFGVEVVDGFDQADAADLEQVIHIFIAGGKAFDDTEHQS